jgi:methionyl-tRNA formyltransferase
MESVFSVRPLQALLRAGHDVRFVMRPMGPLSTRTKPILRRHRGFDVAIQRLLGRQDADPARRDPFAVAADADIPAWLVGNASTAEAARLVQRERVELLVISFFNQLLKPPLLGAAPLGAVNLHPSLLPTYRGPAPLFWTYRDGAAEAGLTIHRVTAGEDDGDILAQQPVPVDELAAVAERSLVDVLGAIEQRRAVAVPQDATKATRAPRPQEQDQLVDAALGARRAFHFVRGVGRWNPLVVDVAGTRVRVVDAVELDEGKSMPGEVALVGDTVCLGCADGSVMLRAQGT